VAVSWHLHHLWIVFQLHPQPKARVGFPLNIFEALLELFLQALGAVLGTMVPFFSFTELMHSWAPTWFRQKSMKCRQQELRAFYFVLWRSSAASYRPTCYYSVQSESFMIFNDFFMPQHALPLLARLALRC
jgi:hypothetical protein